MQQEVRNETEEAQNETEEAQNETGEAQNETEEVQNETGEAQKNKETQSLPTDEDKNQIHSIREYQKLFMKSIPKSGLSKVHGSVAPALSYVRPRSRMPPTGMPVIFVAEGLQTNKYNSLICPGRCFYIGQAKKFVTLGIIWVSYDTINNMHELYCE